MQQSGQGGLGSEFFKTGLKLGSKVLGSEIGKKVINKGIDNIANIFKFGASKIKNKTINNALNSEIADLVVNEAQGRATKNTIAQTCLVKKWVEYQTHRLKKSLKKIDDQDLLDNFVGVFPSNYMNKFINHAAMIENAGKYPFIIANTDAADKTGQHLWSILDIKPRTDIFFFDSYGIEGLKHFIIQDDRAIVDKILTGIEKIDKTDDKITLCKVKCNLSACKKLSKKEIDSLSETARDFFYYIQAFGIKFKLRGFVNIWMVEDRLQELDSATCGIFQIYFYQNLFNPEENSKIQRNAKLNKKKVETLLNELFSLDDKENEI